MPAKGGNDNVNGREPGMLPIKAKAQTVCRGEIRSVRDSLGERLR
jgi:hypothetical protein